MKTGDVGGDVLNTNISESGNVVAGKGNTQNVYHDPLQSGDRNVQQVVNVGHDEAHRYAEDTHVITVRLLNDWLGRFEKRMDRESDERRKAQDELRQELDEVKRLVSDMANRFGHAIRLPYGHVQIFAFAFVMLWIPTPLYLSDVRTILGVSWLFACGFTILAYMVSAFLWGYLWFGGGRS